jgi:hypothetical protein
MAQDEPGADEFTDFRVSSVDVTNPADRQPPGSGEQPTETNRRAARSGSHDRTAYTDSSPVAAVPRSAGRCTSTSFHATDTPNRFTSPVVMGN